MILHDTQPTFRIGCRSFGSVRPPECYAQQLAHRPSAIPHQTTLQQPTETGGLADFRIRNQGKQ